jgi:membrane associated rhomboid family serine protease
MHAPLWVPILVVTPAVLVGGLTLLFEHSLMPHLSALVSFPGALAGLIGGLLLSRPLRRNS